MAEPLNQSFVPSYMKDSLSYYHGSFDVRLSQVTPRASPDPLPVSTQYVNYLSILNNIQINDRKKGLPD